MYQSWRRYRSGLRQSGAGFIVPAAVGDTCPAALAIGSLQLYLKAESYALSDNDPISTNWTDSSGHSRAGVPTNTPLFRTNQLNGLPAIEFTSANGEYFDGFNSWDPSGYTAGSFYIVVKTKADPPGAGADSGLFEFGTDQTTHFPFTDGTIYEGFGTNSRKTVINPTPSLTSWHLYSGYSAANDWDVFLDGAALIAPITTNTVAFPTAPAIGRNAAINVFLNGFVEEFWFFNAKLSSGDDTLVKQCIAGRTGLSIS